MATLEQLDAWGTLEALDAYGTLEQMDSLVLHEASGAGTIALTELGASILLHGMSASESISMSGTATANYGVNIDGSASIAITEVANSILLHGMSASEPIAITENASATRIQAPSIIDANVVITGQVPLTRILATASASANISISALMVGEILGELWSDVSGRTVTWSIN